MGMFTTIVHPETGFEIQIKTGSDNCDRYSVGDTVDWRISSDAPGEGTLLDGAYEGEAFEWVADEIVNGIILRMGRHEHRGHFWTIIKDHVVVAVVPVELNDPNNREAMERYGIFKEGLRVQCAYMEYKYGVQLLPMDAWTDAAWAAKAKQEEHWQREQRRWAAQDYGKTAVERARGAINNFTRAKMREDGIMHRIMAQVPVAEQKQHIADVDVFIAVKMKEDGGYQPCDNFPRNRDDLFEALKLFAGANADFYDADVMYVSPALEQVLVKLMFPSDDDAVRNSMKEALRAADITAFGCKLVFDAPRFSLENTKNGFNMVGFPPVVAAVAGKKP